MEGRTLLPLFGAAMLSFAAGLPAGAAIMVSAQEREVAAVSTVGSASSGLQEVAAAPGDFGAVVIGVGVIQSGSANANADAMMDTSALDENVGWSGLGAAVAHGQSSKSKDALATGESFYRVEFSLDAPVNFALDWEVVANDLGGLLGIVAEVLLFEDGGGRGGAIAGGSINSGSDSDLEFGVLGAGDYVLTARAFVDAAALAGAGSPSDGSAQWSFNLLVPTPGAMGLAGCGLMMVVGRRRRD